MQAGRGRTNDASMHPPMKRGHPGRTEDNAMKSRKKKKKNVPKVSQKLVGKKRSLNGYILY